MKPAARSGRATAPLRASPGSGRPPDPKYAAPTTPTPARRRAASAVAGRRPIHPRRTAPRKAASVKAASTSPSRSRPARVGAVARASAPSSPSEANPIAQTSGSGRCAASGTSQARVRVQASAGPSGRGSPASVSNIPRCQRSISAVRAHQPRPARRSLRNGSTPAAPGINQANAPQALHVCAWRASAGRACRRSPARCHEAVRKRVVAAGLSRAARKSASASRTHCSPSVRGGELAPCPTSCP